MTVVPVIVRQNAKEFTIHIVMDNVRYIEESDTEILVHCGFECDDDISLLVCGVGSTLRFSKGHDDVSALITYLHPDSKA